MAGKGFREGEVLCWKFWISMERLSLCHAEQRSGFSFIFLYLSHHNGKTMSKKHVAGNIFRKGQPKQLQSNPLKRKMFETRQLNIMYRVKTAEKDVHRVDVDRIQSKSVPDGQMMINFKDNTEEENLLTRTIPRSNSNLAKPQAQPLAIQLFAPEDIIIFTHTHTHTERGRSAGSGLKPTLKLQIGAEMCSLSLSVLGLTMPHSPREKKSQIKTH